MEQTPEQNEEATLEAILGYFRSGDRMEAQRLFDQWLQERNRETDEAGNSAGRLVLAVETMEVYAAAGERDMFLLQYAEVDAAIGLDGTIPEEARTELAERLARSWQEVM